MGADSPIDLTALIEDACNGVEGARARLFDAVYAELRARARDLMGRERRDHTLQPTALVHEATLRLLRGEGLSRLRVRNRAYFFGAMGRAMRQVLVEHARGRDAQKRGGHWVRTSLDDALDAYEDRGIDLAGLDEALEELEARHPGWYAAVNLRHFCGLGEDEISGHLGLPVAVVRDAIGRGADWLVARMTEEPR